MSKALTQFGPQAPQADVSENKNADSKPRFYECGICGHMHPASWNGDCRDDANRFTKSAIEDKYGREKLDAFEGEDYGWEEVPMPGSEDDE